MFTNKNSKPLEMEDRVNAHLVLYSQQQFSMCNVQNAKITKEWLEVKGSSLFSLARYLRISVRKKQKKY